jgi:hypothetical protein
MVGPAMCFHDCVVDYIFHEIKKKDHVVYLGGALSISDIEPSNISVLFLLFLL